MAHPNNAAGHQYVRHELRTPINHILSYGQLLREDAEAAGDSSLAIELQLIDASARQALVLIGTLFGDDVEEPSEAIGEDLRLIMAEIQTQVEGLQARIQPTGDVEILADLERMAVATTKFTAVLNEALVPGSAGGARATQPGTPQPAMQASRPARSEATLAAAYRQSPSPNPGGRILVVDDDEGNRSALCRMLERLGHIVLPAENGQEALDKMASEPVDLVLLDIMMPVMDGYEVLEQRRANPALRDLPFVMISALDEMSSVVRCIEMGAEDYLPKPFDPILLRARVEACLEKKRLRDQEVEYLRQVGIVTDAAASVEDRSFQPDCLEHVASRTDALGQLARVFRRVAQEVLSREIRLQRQVEQLKIEVDDAKKTREVAAISDTDYFKDLQHRASSLRARVRADSPARRTTEPTLEGI